MSILATTFTTMLGGGSPAATHSYSIQIPELFLDLAFPISNIDVPVYNRSSVQVDFKGEKLELPAGNDTTGHLKMKIIENPSLSIRYSLLMSQLLDFTVKSYTDVIIYTVQQAVPTRLVTLKNCWIKGRSNLPLAYETVTVPMIWDVDVVYNGIDESIAFTDLPSIKLGAQLGSSLLNSNVVSPITSALAGTSVTNTVQKIANI